jgi:hypothetical protein
MDTATRNSFLGAIPFTTHALLANCPVNKSMRRMPTPGLSGIRIRPHPAAAATHLPCGNRSRRPDSEHASNDAGSLNHDQQLNTAGQGHTQVDGYDRGRCARERFQFQNHQGYQDNRQCNQQAG